MILSFDPDQPRPGVFTFAARDEAYWYSFTEASALQSGQQSRAYCDRSHESCGSGRANRFGPG